MPASLPLAGAQSASPPIVAAASRLRDLASEGQNVNTRVANQIGQPPVAPHGADLLGRFTATGALLAVSAGHFLYAGGSRRHP